MNLEETVKGQKNVIYSKKDNSVYDLPMSQILEKINTIIGNYNLSEKILYIEKILKVKKRLKNRKSKPQSNNKNYFRKTNRLQNKLKTKHFKDDYNLY